VVTIHSDHPFLEPESERDPGRRLRGRLGGAVTLWTTGAEGSRPAGLTISSVMVAHGDPAHVVGLVDPESDLAAELGEGGTAVVQLLQWQHRDLADAFAGVAPAPGGPFRMGSWDQSSWGPVLRGVSAWAGLRFPGSSASGREVGWSLLLDGVVEHVELGEETAPLVHRRGRYVRPT
jgi:flavin reductase (DIM6/NTAB) family NADH-FMN oxidoreductase RutF